MSCQGFGAAFRGALRLLPVLFQALLDDVELFLQLQVGPQNLF